MIKKFLLTSAALLSMTGAWAIDDIKHDGITYSVSSSNIENNAIKKTTKETEESGNKATITEKITWSGKVSNIYVVEPTDLGDATSITFGEWTETLPSTNMESESDPETYNYEIDVEKYKELAIKYTWTMPLLRYFNYQVNLQTYTLNAADLTDSKYDVLVAYPVITEHPLTHVQSTVYFCIENFVYRKNIGGFKENENIYRVETFNANLINSDITSLTIGSTVTGHTGDFRNAEGLTSITSKSSAYEVVNEDRSVFLYNAGKTVLLYTSASNKIIELPGSVTSIAEGALAHCQNLVIKASGITGNPVLEGTNNILHKNEAILNGYVVTGFINQTAFDAISFEEGQSYDFTGATIEGSIDASDKINAKNNLILFFAEGADVTADKNVVIGGTCSNLVLEDGVAYNNTIKKFEAEEITYNRTLGIDENEKGVWNATIVPFAINDVSQFDVAKLISADASGFTVQQQTSMIENTPYLIRSKADSNTKKAEKITSINITVPTYVYMSNAQNSYSVNGVEFTGVYNEFNAYEAGYRYYTYTSEGNFVFVRKNTLAVFSPFHAYIKVSENFFSTPSAASVRFIDQFEEVIDENGISTDIEVIENVNANNDVVYDLNGKKVANLSARKLYIQNGKKFIKK